MYRGSLTLVFYVEYAQVFTPSVRPSAYLSNHGAEGTRQRCNIFVKLAVLRNLMMGRSRIQSSKE